MKYILKIIVILMILGVACHLPPAICHAGTEKYVRVAIIQDAAFLSLKVSGFYEIIDSASKEVLYRDKNLKTTVTAYKNGILIGGRNFSVPKLLIKKEDSAGTIVINGRIYRGNMQFIKKDNLHLVAINYIESEDYIKGILYHEVSHYWPQESLKAQAIACRTYAFYQMQENASKDYDVTSDIYSQVYGGRISERSRTNRAVKQSKGYILTYQGKVFPAYYHAACAGNTEDASRLWDIDIPPLKGVTCNFCNDAPHFKWHTVLSFLEIKDALVKAGHSGCGNIKEIYIMGQDKSGRVERLSMITDKDNIDISAKDFRNIIGPNVIRSTNFTLNVVNSDVIFEGFGWGHGVGLCQWGAYFMAKKGYTAEQILKHYYPGCEISSNNN